MGFFDEDVDGGEEGVCSLCGGTGEISTDERDESGNIMHGVGVQKCHCQIHEPWEDRDEDLDFS